MNWMGLIAFVAAGVAAGHTAPSSWSKDSMFEVQWSMGPADVARFYPGLRTNHRAHHARAAESYDARGKIYGLPTLYSFKFLRGRLAQVKLMPGAGSKGETTEDEDTRQRVWSTLVLKSLSEKYGPATSGGNAF